MIHTGSSPVWVVVNYANIPVVYRVAEASREGSPAVGLAMIPGGRSEESLPCASREAATDLISAIAENRSEEAFAELFDRYAGRLKHFFVQGGIEAARAEELTQDVLLTIWRRADSFDASRSSGVTWLYALARNRRIDELRLRGHPAVRSEDLAWDCTRTASTAGSFETLEQRDALREAIIDLPQEQRAVLQHSFFEGRSMSEIAERNGLPLGTVKSRARLALQHLRRALHNSEETE